MRVLASASVLAAALAVASPAAAATRFAVDRDDGVSFRLDGRVLTVRLLPSQEPPPGVYFDDADGIEKELFGRRITAFCGTSLRDGRGVVTHRERLWPRGRRALRFRLPRDVSRRAAWCLVEHRGGGDIALATFGRRSPRLTG